MKESRFPAPACGGRRLRSTAFNGRSTPLVPLASLDLPKQVACGSNAAHLRFQPSIAGRRQKGIALVMVLWILLLVTISTGAYTLMARMDQLEAHTVISSTRARMAAESGINLAVLSLRDPDELTRMVPDGRPYTIQVQDVLVEIQVTDERGKVGINSVDEPTLLQLFQGHGLEGDECCLPGCSDFGLDRCRRNPARKRRRIGQLFVCRTGRGSGEPLLPDDRRSPAGFGHALGPVQEN